MNKAQPMTEAEIQELRAYLEPLSLGSGGFAYESDNRIARLLATVEFWKTAHDRLYKTAVDRVSERDEAVALLRESFKSERAVSWLDSFDEAKRKRASG